MNRLVWFRNDLRLHDNETLTAAFADGDAQVTCVYVYDEKWDAPTPEGFARFGPFRKRFIAESVIELRDHLLELGSELICLVGNPTEIVPALCAHLEIHELYHSRLLTFDERRQERTIENQVNARGVRCRSFETHALLNAEDFRDGELTQPMGFSKLKRMAETAWNIRAPLPAPSVVRARRTVEISAELTAWAPESFLNSIRSEVGIHLTGGESAALARVEQFFWSADGLRSYKDTRNGLLALDDSSKFSAALSLGCLSARHLYAEVRRYEDARVRNSSTLWFLYELLWRDFFYFASLGRGHGLFTEPWTPAEPKSPELQRKSFEYWRTGRTGDAFVDAAMTELHQTGWMSNRMRQNAASYLVHHLKVDWRAGARWFESCLIDYDCASNWGNWAYVAGAGPRNSPHVFDVRQQARMYDPDGEYARYWATT